MSASYVFDACALIAFLNDESTRDNASHGVIGEPEAVIEPYRRAIRRQFNLDRGFPKLDLATLLRNARY